MVVGVSYMRGTVFYSQSVLVMATVYHRYTKNVAGNVYVNSEMDGEADPVTSSCLDIKAPINHWHFLIYCI